MIQIVYKNHGVEFHITINVIGFIPVLRAYVLGF